MQRVAATGIGPYSWECDLGAGSLLQQQLVPGIEQKDTERSMQAPLWLLSCEPVGVIFASVPCYAVFAVYKYAFVLVHKLFLGALACSIQRNEQIGRAFRHCAETIQ